ncbi:MAG: UbiA family prenyltransferase [candidate division WOR-3 bacterium]
MRGSNILDWLRVMRAQTGVATALVYLVPFLHGSSDYLWAAVLGAYSLIVHFFSFGHNSLMDTAMGYDVKDPNKKHHPLVSGRIPIYVAHTVIQFGLLVLTVIGGALALYLSPNSAICLLCLLVATVSGYSYNCGLAKESYLGCIPISLYFSLLGAYAWLLSHQEIGILGASLIAYLFMTVMFQIAWSGHLKDIEVKERSNLLVMLGARVEEIGGVKVFIPGRSLAFGYAVKILNLIAGAIILWINFDMSRAAFFALFSAGILFMLRNLTKRRAYVRSEELKKMSIMEILTIYMVIPLMLPWVTSLLLMLAGVIYFFLLNKLLWGVGYPAV